MQIPLKGSQLGAPGPVGLLLLSLPRWAGGPRLLPLFFSFSLSCYQLPSSLLPPREKGSEEHLAVILALSPNSLGPFPGNVDFTIKSWSSRDTRRPRRLGEGQGEWAGPVEWSLDIWSLFSPTARSEDNG